MRGMKLVLPLAAAALLITAALWARSAALAKQFPQPTIHLAAPGEALDIEGLRLTVESATLLEGSQIVEHLNGYQPLPVYPENSMKIIMVDIHVSNVSQDRKSFSWPRYVLRSGAWANGFDPDAVRALQPEVSWETSMAPGDEMSITLTSLLTEWSIGVDDWDTAVQRDYSLDLLQYPDYYRLQLPELQGRDG